MTNSRSFSASILGSACLVAALSTASQTDAAPSGSANSSRAELPQTASSDAPNTASAETKANKTHDADGGLVGEPALLRNFALYESGQYDACVVGLRDVLNSTRGAKLQRPELIDQAATYLGACLIASGQPEQADQVFIEAIRSNPQMRAPDNLVFPQTVVDRFLRVRERLLTDIRRDERNRVREAEHKAQQQDEQRKQAVRVTEQLRAIAAKETVIEKNRRWLATVPFGVGQFQNGDNAAGWLFLGLESALAGTCIAALVIDEHLANQALIPGVDRSELHGKRVDAHRVMVASSWGLAAVLLGGIVHAHWRFVPERRYNQKRALPFDLSGRLPEYQSRVRRNEPRSSASMTLSIFPSGPGIGIAGSW
jgi:hypothetical protein